MPRKSAASAAAKTPPGETNGDVSMISEAPVAAELPQPSKDDTTKQTKKKDKDGPSVQHSDVVSLDDLLLPRSIIQRLAKGVLPPNTSLQRDAVLALAKSATVFISLLASTANDLTERKTITSVDVIKALREIELDQVMQLDVTGKDGRKGGRVEREVEVWEKEVKGKRKGYRERVKARESGSGGIDDSLVGDTTAGSILEDVNGAEENELHETKRQRIDVGDGTSREGSTGTIEQGTTKLKLNVARRKPEPDEDVDEEEIIDDDVGSEEDDFESAEEEQDPEETQGPEDSIDVDREDDENTSRRNGTLIANGRVEVGASDDESD